VRHWTGVEMLSDHPEIFDLIENNSLDELKSLLESGMNPHQVNWEEGVTALELGVATANVNVVKALLTANSHPDFGLTCCPLEYAIIDGNVELTQILVNSGANVNCTLDNGESYAAIAKNRGYNEILTIIETSKYAM
jgi:ankyrin repeat protein